VGNISIQFVADVYGNLSKISFESALRDKVPGRGRECADSIHLALNTN
jgi:hypothetical protein